MSGVSGRVICVMYIGCASFYEVSIRFWKCSDDAGVFVFHLIISMDTQSVSVTANAVKSLPVLGKVWLIQFYVIMFISNLHATKSVVFYGYFGFLHQ